MSPGAIPVIYASDLSPEQLRAYALAENKLSELGGWSIEIAALEFRELSDLDLGFDLTVTGFETGEIDLMLVDQPDDGHEEPPIPSVPRDHPPVSSPGDAFRIGKHLVVCGDALTAEAYRHLPKPADIVFTDSPYNVKVQDISGLGRNRHPEFVMASGEMSKAEFTAFLRGAASQLVAHSTDGSIHFLCMDFRHMAELLSATEGVYSELKALCVWTKTNAGMGSLYRSQHELVFVLKAGTARHVNNVELGYGKPPVKTRFQCGESGNPKGRKKGNRNLKTDLMEELAERITLKEGGRTVRLSKQRAIAKAFDLWLRLAGPTDQTDDATPLSAADQKTLDSFFERKKERGYP